jgi:transcription antitermination factor NusG
MAWYVLYTKSRNEKKVARLLSDKGIVVFCPIQEVVKQWSDRKKKIQEPVFRSYVFVQLDNYETESVKVLMTAGAVRFLWWLGKPGVVRDKEIQLIKDFLNRYRGSAIVLELKKGQEVTIQDGPLKDNKGKVIKILGKKAILFIKSLGLNLVAEVPIQALS